MNAATTARRNGADPRADAVQTEAEIAAQAAEIRGDAVGLTRELFLKLWPLLRKPIPEGFIKSIGVVKGKPYPSTGITSVQVQIDRMDNVLTPLGWTVDDDYLEEGKVAIVTVKVLDAAGDVLYERSSRGGVNQASTSGNLYKGSYTNAAKVAFARVGPGHEVYLGTTDLDPDVHEDAAAAQASGSNANTGAAASDQPLSRESQQKVVDAFAAAGVTDDFPLYLKAVGIGSLEEMAAAHAHKLREMLDAEIARKAAKS